MYTHYIKCAIYLKYNVVHSYKQLEYNRTTLIAS
nr:MAG TPA: hypothetical protein [Caudoviricetes sp.]